MFATVAQTVRFHRPALRRVMAILCVIVYLLAGALHGACDIDVTNPAPHSMAVMSGTSDAGHNAADKAMIADHHCHGCFSVSVADPVSTSVPVAFSSLVRAATQPDHIGATPVLDTPPPKHLT